MMNQPHSQPTYLKVETGGTAHVVRATIEPGGVSGGHVQFRISRRWTLGERPLTAGTIPLVGGAAAFRAGMLPAGAYVVTATYIPVPGSDWAMSSATAPYRV